MILDLEITVIEGAIDPSSRLGLEWENLLSENIKAGFMQSLHWAGFKQSCGHEIYHLLVRQDQILIAGCILYLFPDKLKPGIILAPCGPLLPWQEPSLASACLRLILLKSEEIAKRTNALSFRIEPRLEHPAPSILNEFAAAAVNQIPAETLRLDLSRSLDEIRAQMKAKCRYNIKLAARRQVVVRELRGDSAGGILYELLQEAAHRDHFYLEPEEFFHKLAAALMPPGVLRIFLAEHEGDKLGVLALLTIGVEAVYLYGGISNRKRQFMAGYALQWRAIEEAKKQACRFYDFYGYDQFQSPSHSYARFSRFKSGFGGKSHRFIGAREIVFLDRVVDNIIQVFNDSLQVPHVKR